jgi:hypothetical protein
LCPGGNIKSKPGIVVDGVIVMLVWRKVIIGHIVMAHTTIPIRWWDLEHRRYMGPWRKWENITM